MCISGTEVMSAAKLNESHMEGVWRFISHGSDEWDIYYLEAAGAYLLCDDPNGWFTGTSMPCAVATG